MKEKPTDTPIDDPLEQRAVVALELLARSMERIANYYPAQMGALTRIAATFEHWEARQRETCS